MTTYANHAECDHVGVDPAEVDRIMRRLLRACRDAGALGLVVFGGSGSIDIRCPENVIVASSSGALNVSGGDGAIVRGGDGLLRGER